MGSAETRSASTHALHKLRTAVENGVFPPGVRLPGERTLAARLSVSRQTLRQALQQLAEQGLLRPSPQRGWYVTSNAVSDPPSVLQSFTDLARARGRVPGTTVLEVRQKAAGAEESQRLGLAPEAPVLELRRLRSLDGVPVAIDHTHVALERTPGLADTDLNDVSLYGALEEVCGVRVTRCDYSVRADWADDETAELLQIGVGEPVLVGDELTYDFADVPILTGHLVYRADAYLFRATLYRPALDA